MPKNITRRDLLKYCAVTGGVFGLSAGMLERKNESALRIGGKGKTASKIYQQMLDEGLDSPQKDQRTKRTT
jgi:hypothetical protein